MPHYIVGQVGIKIKTSMTGKESNPLQEIAEFTPRYLTLLFFDPISVNPHFVQDGVKKITTSLSFCNFLYKTMQAFDIVLKKYMVLM